MSIKKNREKNIPRFLLGSKFQKLLAVKVTEDMREYTKRKGFDVGVSAAEWIRGILFPKGWPQELETLRRIQDKKGE